jgi:catechol 2,3-dioxygenase-like lactoylglutathione lyase family enzyme
MTDAEAQTRGKTTLTGAEPQLIVSDIAASIEFFTRKLGFVVAFTHGEPAFYAQVCRDAARLNLRHVDLPRFDAELRDREQLLSASITLADAEPLFLEYQAAGVVFMQPLKTEPWGARTFVVRDPDGNLILFAGHGE